MQRNSILFSALFFALTAPLATAQFRAGLQGSVMDPSQAAVPGATVTLHNNETSQEQKAVTSSEGFYRFSALAPGSYTINAEKQGFAKLTITNVQVAGETVQGLDLHLKPGEISNSVTVTGESLPPLETENANVQRSISEQEILRLPQIGRDPYELLRLTPGIFGSGSRSGSGQSVALPNTTGPGGSNLSVFQTENQVPIVANGQRLSANNFQIDGVSVNSLTWGGAAVVSPNQESVKEVTVIANGYSADLGRNSGAQIQVVSKNGTNEVHGSGVFKLDDPNFNAFNRFGTYNGPAVRVQNAFKQYGTSVGGPIKRDRLFFFFSYEGLHNASDNPYTGYVETDSYRQAVLNARAGTVTSKVLGSTGIAPRILSQIPIACASTFAPGTCQQLSGGLDLGSFAGGPGVYTTGVGGGLDGQADVQYALLSNPARQTGNQYNGRVDYSHGNDIIAVSTYVTLFNGTTADTSAGSRPQADLINTPLTTAITATYNRVITPSLVNEARANFTRFASNQITASTTTNWGIPRVEVESYPFGRLEFGAPRSEATPAVFAQNTIEGRDTVNWVRGNHAFKFGVEVRREQDNNNLAGGARPDYSFSGLWNLANDAVLFEAINADPNTGAPASAQRYFRSGVYAGFIQDDWKITPSFMLNLGLRYEYFPAPSETRGRLSNLQFGSQGLLNSRLVVTDSMYEADKMNFGPRFGFAYNPSFYDKRIVFRGGFGMFYNRVPDALFDNSRGNPPFFARYGICCGSAASPRANNQILYAVSADNTPFGYPVNSALAVGIDPVTGAPNGPNSVEVWGTPAHVGTPYSFIYSLESSMQLPGKFVATAGYQGSSGHKLIRIVNQNYLYPNNPKFGPVYFIQPDVNSVFNAFLFTVTRSLTNGVQFQFNYRYAHSIDEASYEGPGFVTNQTYPQNLKAERGSSDFDVRHNFNLSALYELPFAKGGSRLRKALLGGFQINGILTYHTGFPWTPVTGQSVSTPGGPSLSPTRPVAYYGGAGHDYANDTFLMPNGNFPGGGTKYFDITHSGFPGIGRNSFEGPRYFDTDFSVVKQFRLGKIRWLGENALIDIRANFFNVFNKLNLAPFNFGDANTHPEDATFGRALTGLSGRVVEFQGRISF